MRSFQEFQRNLLVVLLANSRGGQLGRTPLMGRFRQDSGVVLRSASPMHVRHCLFFVSEAQLFEVQVHLLHALE